MVTRSYQDLCREIQMLETRVEDLKKEYRFYLGFLDNKPKGVTTSTIREDKVQSSNPYMPPQEAYRKCAEINELLVQYDEIITGKMEVKAEIEKGMSEFETLEGKINYLFHIENMKLYEIADELGYSYDWIREVKNKYERNNPQYTHKNKIKVC